MKTVLTVILILILLLFAASFIALRLTTANIKKKSGRSKARALDADRLFGDEIKKGREYIRTVPFEEWRIQSFDGLTLYGRFFKNGSSSKTIILFHGFRSSGEHDFSCAFKMYYEHGLNILIPDQRTHGKSEGSYIGYGVLERFDALDWTKKVISECGSDEKIFLSGVSMGASTVLMASGLELPENVKAIVADCGFTSPEEIIKKVMTKDMHIPAFPLYYTTRLLARLLAHYDFKYSTLDALKDCRVPVLFIHGKADDFVPFYMSGQNYAACPTEKRAVWVEGAGHGTSFLFETEHCVEEFEKIAGLR